ncbi:MAG: dTDP-glucose pyrophosphorylase [Alphaproteobacteria bacterium]|nr:dTDP-glucose pyrophosphorylase [Alphaproteobacteria bacterium]
MDDPPKTGDIELIGLVPAAGRATRLAPMPFSKELYPVGTQVEEGGRVVRSRAVCDCLLGNMQASGVARAFVIIRDGKWDIPAYLGDGAGIGMPIGYLLKDGPVGVPYTLDVAYPYVRGYHIALGFPDMVFDAPDAFRICLNQLTARDADVVLGLFPTDTPSLVDMVAVDGQGAVTGIEIKPAKTALTRCWAIAAWRPTFTEFLHRYLRTLAERGREAEHFVGHVILAAIDDGLRVVAEPVSDRPVIDVGTPDGLVALQRGLNERAGI